MTRSLALFGLAAMATATLAEEPSPLTLCLAPAADNSAVYPLKEVPASNRELMVVFQLRAGESFGKLERVWTAVDVGDAAPANTEIAKEETALQGMTRGNLKFTLPRDLPVGKYRLDVSADGKPWASLEFPVVPAKEATPLAKPGDLMPLEPGTKWTYSWVLEPGPTIKKLNVAGAEQGADGKCRATMAVAVAGRRRASPTWRCNHPHRFLQEPGRSLSRQEGVQSGGCSCGQDALRQPRRRIPLRGGRGRDGRAAGQTRPLPLHGPGAEKLRPARSRGLSCQAGG